MIPDYSKVDKRIKETKKYKIEFLLLQVRMILLTPFKLLHMLFCKYYINSIIEFISVVSGIGVCEYFIWLFFPLEGKTTLAFMVLSIFNVTVVAYLILFVVDNIIKFFTYILEYSTYRYNKIREIIRNEKDDYSIGLDEKAKVGINQFIKKDKKEKEFTFKG